MDLYLLWTGDCFSSKIEALLKSMKCLTVQSPREFVAARCAPGYAPSASYFSATLFPSLFLSLNIDDSGKRPTSPYDCTRLFPGLPLSLRCSRQAVVWISSALFHPRRTYFNDSRHREVRRMLNPSPPFATISEYAAECLIVHSLQLGFHRLRGTTNPRGQSRRDEAKQHWRVAGDKNLIYVCRQLSNFVVFTSTCFILFT